MRWGRRRRFVVRVFQQKRDVAVLLSPREYDRLRALNSDEFKRFCDEVAARAKARGLTEEKLPEILAE